MHKTHHLQGLSEMEASAVTVYGRSPSEKQHPRIYESEWKHANGTIIQTGRRVFLQ